MQDPDPVTGTKVKVTLMMVKTPSLVGLVNLWSEKEVLPHTAQNSDCCSRLIFLQTIITWEKTIIRTEGALRLPTTYDNHPSQSHPTCPTYSSE